MNGRTLPRVQAVRELMPILHCPRCPRRFSSIAEASAHAETHRGRMEASK